ncbi:MAG: NAD(P)/FAD-dependent oxidoreductase [Candidatus Methylomirabilales bacterium]
MKRTADVVVVGGGPAGSAVAILLARVGLKVCLLEKSHFPREKPCGEYVSPGCLSILDRLGLLSALEALGPQSIRGMRIVAPGGTVLTGVYPGNGTASHGYSLPRYRFDALLFDAARKAGVECHEGWRVVDLIREGGGVAGVVADSEGRSRSFTASVTIGADGRNSVVARRLKLFAWHRTHRKVALLRRFQVPVDVGDVGEVYLGKTGYCILNPQGRGVLNIGVVVDQQDLPLHQAWERVLCDLFVAYPRVRGMLEGAHPLNAIRVFGPLACRATRVAGDGFLLVGDAAGYYDPMTGEGVYQALRGAELAAKTVAEALSNGGPTAGGLGRYAVCYRGEFAPKDRVCHLLQQIVCRPFLCDLLIRRLNDRPTHAEELMGVVGDLLAPRRLLRPAFWLRLLFRPAIDEPIRRA